MFFNGIDKKTIYTILGFLVVYTLIATGEFQAMMLTLPGVILAMTFHEFAHAWMADRLGDKTPRAQGRLSLNPANHIDPVGLILLLFVHIGWGKPVQINPNNFNSNKSRTTCEALVSLAGPLMNFILAFILLIIIYACEFVFKITLPTVLFLILFYAVVVNVGLGVFNLIPIPPLDGSKIFRKILPGSVNRWLDINMQYIYLVFMLLWITGMLSIVVSPVINAIYNGMNYAVAAIFNLFI